MSREIEFRCWNEHGKCFHGMNELGDKLHLFNNKNPSYVVEQFTGLLDCNGVKIFEGDIVKMFYQDWLDKTQVIMFMEGTFGYGDGKFMFSAFHCLDMDMRGASHHFSYAFEVIGNIHQHPEILT
ncbi:YopX family protein [Shewanella sp.]|uniref:YopX family protein n=1 Tax=Shewanella sp. TaxID=50422 RepID=UPI001B53B3C1|nr:YopX family protein [Shewanella sp.]MBP6517877.1 hypothetical protein [Shewanella sp.]